MATTPGDYEIYYPLASDEIAPLQSHFSTLATSVSDNFEEFVTPLRDGLQTKNYKVDTFTQLTALTSVVPGSRGYVTVTKAHYVYDDVGWVPAYIPWTNYTPTDITGLTFDVARYTVSNNMVTVNVEATKNSTASNVLALDVSLPLTASSIVNNAFPVGQGVFRKAGTGLWYPLTIFLETTGTSRSYFTTGSPATLSVVRVRPQATTRPALAVTGDKFLFNFTYSL
jgi:hypothetical protein